MSIQPLGDRVLVKVLESESKTKGGLYIPDNAKEKTTQGTVVAIGSSEDIKVKVGDSVLYDKYAGASVTVDGVDPIDVRDRLAHDDVTVTVSHRSSTLLDMTQRGLAAVVRASPHYFISYDDLDRFTAALTAI